jgi:hypothetical protein
LLCGKWDATQAAKITILSANQVNRRLVMKGNSEERITELGKLLKGKIRADWSLIDEAYRERFEELMWLLYHRESVVVAFMMQYVSRGRADRQRNREGNTAMQAAQ